MKKTKIIATIGPNSSSKETLKELILNGLDVVRINLSHATYDFCIDVFKTIETFNNNKQLITKGMIILSLFNRLRILYT